MAYNTLANIQRYVRLITRSVSENQLSTDDLNNYINTFILYNFPENIKTFNLRQNFTFYLTPNIDTYSTTTTNPLDPLYQFKQKYMDVFAPVYIAGYQSFFTQDQQQFYTIYPKLSFISQIALGTGTNSPYIGNLQSVPVLQNSVTFTAQDVNGNAMVLYDVPQPGGTQNANLVLSGTNTVYGTLNYITGAYNFQFPTAPAAGKSVLSQSYFYIAALPQAMMFFNDQFIFRPVPDQPYTVEFVVYARPTQLMGEQSVPQLEEWWEYIAWGASKKIFESRSDFESVQKMMPVFKEQERLVLRRTIVQQTGQRAPTIYSENNLWGWNGWGYGGSIY